MKLWELEQSMGLMQERLYALVEQTGSLVDPRVVKLSQEIDDVVVTMQRLRMCRELDMPLKK
ncbi:Spo0E family sporulation regulatory protein-aspartic acid phosphatase [Paenibacillus sp. TAB 01]|uniref:Spo0E family sporulation regulatory protein-aspartic acid phosphatase n=1 Tax=Paenibacillus sp. TAB 01 TaxID=3368988 RepID=UPI003753117F